MIKKSKISRKWMWEGLLDWPKQRGRKKQKPSS
jgi:hypothetical protein